MFIVLISYLQALADPYFSGLSNSEREPSTQPISKLEFDFERKKLTKDDVRELIYREVTQKAFYTSYYSLVFLIYCSSMILTICIFGKKH